MSTFKSRISIQELDDDLQILLEKAGEIDETLAGIYDSIMKEVSSIFRLPDNSRSGSEPLGAYPDGITVMRLNLPGKEFPNDFGMVLTSKAGAYGFQIFSSNGTTGNNFPKINIRSWNTETSKWTVWDSPETAAGAQEKANQRILRTGDAMTGYLTLHADPIQDKHAATKGYVDALIEGLDIKQSVKVASTGDIAVSTSSAKQIKLSVAMTSLDGIALKAGDRILLKNQAIERLNGIYVYTSSTILDRAEDANDATRVTPGMYTYVEEGSQAGGGWTLITQGPIVLGTTALRFSQFSGAGNIVAGPGLTQMGNEFSIMETGAAAGTYQKVTVNELGQVTGGAALSASDIPELPASKISSGKLAIERIPTGTSSVTVATGNHSHTLQELSNVAVTTPAAKHVLMYDAGVWKNRGLRATDLDILGAAAGKFLKHNGTDWAGADIAASDIPALDAAKIGTGKFALERIPTGTTALTVALGNHKHTIGSLDNVSLAGEKLGEVMTFDGTNWTNRMPQMGDLNGIDAVDAENGDVLKHDGISWKNAKLVAGDIPQLDAAKINTGTFAYTRLPVGTTSSTVAQGNHKHSVEDLSNTVIATPAAGHALVYDGTNWANRKADLSLLDKFNIQGLSTGDVLKFNGTNWVNTKLQETDIPSLNASKIGAGTLAIARLPVGTTSATVAAGNHEHSAYENRIGALEDDMPEISFGLEGHIPFIKADNTNEMEMDRLVKEVAVVNTAEDFELAKTVYVSNREIFDTWERFSHGPNTLVQPGIPGELTGWAYDEAKDLVVATINSTSHIGFISKQSYDSYVHQVTLASDGADNDTIGVLIAAAKDETGRTHTLTALRCNAISELHNAVKGTGFVWAIVYNYQMPDARIVANGTSLLTGITNTTWGAIPNGIKLRVHRNKDFVEVKTSEANETVFNEAATLTIDLNSDADLRRFRGARPYGYTSLSQPNSTYKDIYFSGTQNIIYDLRDGNVWVANASGIYAVDPARSLAELGKGRVLSNPMTGKLFYSRTVEDIVEIGYSSSKSTGIDADNITDGTVSIDRLPVGATSGKVAAGDHGHKIGDLTDVTVTGAVVGDILRHDGTSWQKSNALKDIYDRILPEIDVKISQSGLKEVRLDKQIAAGSYYEYNVSTDFAITGDYAVDARHMQAMVLVKDTDTSSPTYNHFVNSEAVITVSRVSATAIRFYNEYTAGLTVKITVWGKSQVSPVGQQ